MSKLSYEEQLHQYTENYNHLKRLVGEVVSMSHPCGDYNDDTLKILSDLGIQIGFRSSLSITEVKSRFEIPRDDHANILARMKRWKLHYSQATSLDISSLQSCYKMLQLKWIISLRLISFSWKKWITFSKRLMLCSLTLRVSLLLKKCFRWHWISSK